MLHAGDGLGREALPARVDSRELELAQVELALLLALPLLRHELQVHLARRNVALEQEVTRLGLDRERADRIVALTQRRGGPEILDVPGAEGLQQVLELLPGGVADRVIFDLGLVRRLGYYTGAVFEIYDPALGEPLGGGGRYDELLGRFGRPLPAVGFGIGLDALHVALAGEERGT